jgi:hypothetical protein
MFSHLTIFFYHNGVARIFIFIMQCHQALSIPVAIGVLTAGL